MHIDMHLRTSPWAPLPLRAALGIALIVHGGIKLFVPGGHDNIAYLVGQLGAPLPDLMGWVIGIVEFFGGLGMILGVFFPVSTGLNVLNFAFLLVLGGLAGGIPQPLAGGDPLPQFREGFLMLAASLTLFLGGPGRFAIDTLRHRTKQRAAPAVT
jgi:putative oxidoreductase